MKQRVFRMMFAAAMFAAAFVSCRTGRPAGAPVTPLTAASIEEATAQLNERVRDFRGMRTLMRVRATTAGNTQSFRAQLAVHDAQRMELVAYTPVGTTALTMHANGERVSLVNHLENTKWEGNARELPGAFRFLGASATPARLAMLILGLPVEGVANTIAAGGMATADVGDVHVVFEPPAFPARNVVVTRGADRVEIEHLEVVAD